MCGEVRLAVSRDRGIVLFAVAREGLGELRSIGHALRWVSENRTLLGMALPQFAIDTNQSPRLRLLVDQSDLSADLLQPVLQSEHVTVQSYRKLRWGGTDGPAPGRGLSHSALSNPVDPERRGFVLSSRRVDVTRLDSRFGLEQLVRRHSIRIHGQVQSGDGSTFEQRSFACIIRMT